MKKVMLAVLLAALYLMGCSSESVIQEDFKKDIDQILTKFDNAYEENRELNDVDEELLGKFYNKYIIGKFYAKDGKVYEMNDLEKQIVRDIQTLKYFTESTESLASEEDIYVKANKRIKDYMKAKEVPDSLKDKHPTYEDFMGLQPKFEEDTKTLIKRLDSIIGTGNIAPWQIDDLKTYIEFYGGEGFEIDGFHYFMNDEMKDIYLVLWAVNRDVEEGTLTAFSQEIFDDLKSELDVR